MGHIPPGRPRSEPLCRGPHDFVQVVGAERADCIRFDVWTRPFQLRKYEFGSDKNYLDREQS